MQHVNIFGLIRKRGIKMQSFSMLLLIRRNPTKRLDVALWQRVPYLHKSIVIS